MQSGLPRFFPLIEGYYSHITFDDDAMKGVMNLLMDIDYSTREDVAVILTDRIRKAIGFVS